jgi:hypothetical protein
MGLLKSIGKGLKGIGKKVGGVVSKVAPYAGLIPGVGSLAAGALGAGGALVSGKNLKEIAKAGLTAGGGAYLGGKALGALNGSGAIPAVMKGGKIANIQDLITGGGAASSAAEGGGGGLIDRAKGIGSTILSGIKNHPELALGALGAVQHARDTAATDKMYGQGLGDIRTAYAAKAPLRAMALKQLQDPRLKDLSGVFRPRGNPFATA